MHFNSKLTCTGGSYKTSEKVWYHGHSRCNFYRRAHTYQEGGNGNKCNNCVARACVARRAL